MKNLQNEYTQERQNLESLFFQEMIQMLIDLDFNPCQVLWNQHLYQHLWKSNTRTHQLVD